LNRLIFLLNLIFISLTQPVVAQDMAVPDSTERVLGTEYGFIIFQERCTGCHGNPEVEKAPAPDVLRAVPPERIYEALTSGAMQVHTQGLTEQEILRVAESVSGRMMGTTNKGEATAMPNQCQGNEPLGTPDANTDWNGWGGTLANNRFRSSEHAGLTEGDIPRLKLQWAFGFDRGISAFGQPSIVSGRVYVGTDTGYVYSIDAISGCVYWSFRPESNVRNAISIGPVVGYGETTRYAAYFGDLKANVYALDARTGRLLWQRRVDDHFTARVTASPALHEGRLYVPLSSWEEASGKELVYPCCSFRGSIVALDANSGATVWKTYLVEGPPQPVKKNSLGTQLWAPAGVAVWNTPIVDAKRRAIYFGTGDSYTFPAAATSDAIVALDMYTGEYLWVYQVHPGDAYLVGCQFTKTENCPEEVGKDWDIPAPPILARLADGREMIIVSTKPGDVLSLNPDKGGELNWRVNVARKDSGYGGMRWGGANDGENAYFGLMSGGLVAVSLATGNLSWYTPLTENEVQSGHDAPVTILGSAVFVGGMDGNLNAVSAADGSLIWQYNTNREFETVNQVPARGGSISSAGPVFANSMMFVGSGYMIISGKPGNVLLAFSPE